MRETTVGRIPNEPVHVWPDSDPARSLPGLALWLLKTDAPQRTRDRQREGEIQRERGNKFIYALKINTTNFLAWLTEKPEALRVTVQWGLMSVITVLNAETKIHLPAQSRSYRSSSSSGLVPVHMYPI